MMSTRWRVPYWTSILISAWYTQSAVNYGADKHCLSLFLPSAKITFIFWVVSLECFVQSITTQLYNYLMHSDVIVVLNTKDMCNMTSFRYVLREGVCPLNYDRSICPFPYNQIHNNRSSTKKVFSVEKTPKYFSIIMAEWNVPIYYFPGIYLSMERKPFYSLFSLLKHLFRILMNVPWDSLIRVNGCFLSSLAPLH